MPVYEDLTFEPVPNLLFHLILKGAENMFDLAYEGKSKAAASYGGQEVGPEVWKSKDGKNVLMAFRGSTESQICLFQMDPETDPDPVPEFMQRYGDDLLGDMVTQVNYQKIVAGAQWAPDANVGGGGVPEILSGFSSYKNGNNWNPDPANPGMEWHTGGDYLPDCWFHGDWQSGIEVDSQDPGGINSRRPESIAIFYEFISTDGEHFPEIGLKVFNEYGQAMINESVGGAAASGAVLSIPWNQYPDVAIGVLLFEGNEALILDIQFSDADYTGPFSSGGGE